jgi:diacylglycerol kinase family enzyme
MYVLWFFSCQTPKIKEYFCIFVSNMTNRKSIVFILNPKSGTNNKDSIPQIISSTLDKDKFDYQVRLTEYAGHAAVIAKECAEQGINIVVAVGGDGTVNEVARSLVHTETALGIIPCGSGNGLARHLSIPMDVKKSISIINECNIE